MYGHSARQAVINGKTSLCAVCRIGLEDTHSFEIENMQSMVFKAMKPDPWRLGTVSEEVSWNTRTPGGPLSADTFVETIDLVVKDPLREQSLGLDPG